VQNSVRSIPKLDTLILVKPGKKMSFEEKNLIKDLKKLSFSTPFVSIPEPQSDS